MNENLLLLGAVPVAGFAAGFAAVRFTEVHEDYRHQHQTPRMAKDESGKDVEKLASDIRKESGEEIYKQLLDDIKNGKIDGKTRPVKNDKVAQRNSRLAKRLGMM